MSSADVAVTALFERAQREVDERLPACQVALARHGELIAFETFGKATNDDRFLIWSCSKALSGSLVWMLASEGLIDFEAPVASYLPEFASNGKDVITIEQLLTHTAGIPNAPLGPNRWADSAGRRRAFSRWRLNWEPGTRYEYHAVSAGWVLMELAIAVTGRDYRDLITERILDPLGLDRLRLGIPAADQSDVVDLTVVGEPATEEEWTAAGFPYPGAPVIPAVALLSMNAPAAREVGIPSGGACSTAADVAMFYQALLDDRLGLWHPDVLADVTGVVRNTFPDKPKGGLPANRTRGLVVRGSHRGAKRMMHFGPATSPATFGHDGAGGQIAWADPATGLSFCFLTNGMEANLLHEARRCQDFATLAAACAT